MEGGPPIFRQDCTCPALLEDTISRFPVRGCHPLWPAFPGASGTKRSCHWPVPRSLATTDGISVDVLFLRLLRCFSSPGLPPRPYEFRSRIPRCRGGLPHSEIPGSPIARISPGLFAACHVLHRLSVPRHPPDALHLRLIPGVIRQRHIHCEIRRTKPPRTGARAPLSPKRPHMKTLLRIARTALRCAEPIRLGHMTNSLFTLQTTPPPGSPRTVSLDLLQTPCDRVARATPVASPQLRCDRGGGERIRTDDLLLAKQALSQLSYTPSPEIRDQNQRSGFLISDL